MAHRAAGVLHRYVLSYSTAADSLLFRVGLVKGFGQMFCSNASQRPLEVRVGMPPPARSKEKKREWRGIDVGAQVLHCVSFWCQQVSYVSVTTVCLRTGVAAKPRFSLDLSFCPSLIRVWFCYLIFKKSTGKKGSMAGKRKANKTKMEERDDT